MRLTARLCDAMVWLGEPATPETFVTDEMLIELESLGIIEYDRATGKVKFTPAGALEFRYTVGHDPTRNN
jgi:hypothetical protein